MYIIIELCVEYKMFGYLELLREIEKLNKIYSVEVIGKSEFNRDIFALKRGANPKALIHGGIHAREHITAKLVVELAKNYQGDNIIFVPLVNPDGAELCIRGIETAIPQYRDFLLNVNSEASAEPYDFSLWKANGRAVDLNNNFAANWGKGIGNVKYPKSESYIGESPFSERESRALKNITEKNDFMLTISYHSKGEVIYWGYGNNYKEMNIAEMFAVATGYQLKKSIGSEGGYKDWFTLVTGKLGLTIEVGDDRFAHPFPYSQFNDIMKKNSGVTALVDKVIDNG